MSKEQLYDQLNNVRQMANTTKVQRMFSRPFKYLNAILFREIIYKFTKKEKEIQSITFFGIKMNLLLPSSTDIYLTGGKSHDSELRLATFLIKELSLNDNFVDVGAHYGYFTLLASKIVGIEGQVYSFEPSPSTYRILQKNTSNRPSVTINNVALSDGDSLVKFYEFPNLYSEYSTMNVEQFENESWFIDNGPNEIDTKTLRLDTFLLDLNIDVKIIKIDVEGAEYSVINGLIQYLEKFNPFIVMEYLCAERGNEEHKKAEALLNSMGYTSCIIDDTGNVIEEDSISDYLERNSLDSDNVVFVK